MSPIDGVLHLLNFFAPAVFVGVVLPVLARLLWRRELKALALRRTMAWATAAAGLALIAGLVVFGRDGKMATYAAMLAACAGCLWWRGFLSGR